MRSTTKHHSLSPAHPLLAWAAVAVLLCTVNAPLNVHAQATPEPRADDAGLSADTLASSLSAHSFRYLIRRAVTVGSGVDYHAVEPTIHGAWRAQVFAVAAAPDVSYVCAIVDDVFPCWQVDGEVTLLSVPDASSTTTLGMTAVVGGTRRVDFTVTDTGIGHAQSNSGVVVAAFDGHAPQRGASPWVELLSRQLSGTAIVRGFDPVPTVFVGFATAGWLCLERDERFTCSGPFATGSGRSEVAYSRPNARFGSSTVVLARSSRSREGGYFSLSDWLLFDVSGAVPQWTATLPMMSYGRTGLRDERVLNVIVELEARPVVAGTLDPTCFELALKPSSRAWSDVGGESDGVRMAPQRLPRASAIPTDLTQAGGLSSFDFVGRWARNASGGLIRNARCRPAGG